MNIFEKMSAITSELSYVAKNLNVGEGRFAYKAVGEADVLAAVKPLEIKHGIYSYPISRTVIESGVMTNVDRNGNEKKNNFLRIETVYRFVNTEKPDEFIDITTYGDGVDPQDKAPGKAMTYGDKYALLKAYKIQTGEDPDANASEPMKDLTKEKISAVKATALRHRCEKLGVNVETLCKRYGAERLEDLTEDAHRIIADLLTAEEKKRGL